LRDRLLADARRALQAWDKPVAVAAYQRATQLDPASEEAQRGLKSAQRIGDAGFVFRDALGGNAQGPEMVIVTAGGRKLAFARNETTLAEFRAYWQAQGQRTRGGDRPSCRDRESFFRSSRKNTFEAPDFQQAATHPVVCVAWADAADYAVWLSKVSGKRYRLPSADEWSALARAATTNALCRANVADQSYAKAYGGRDAHACDDGFVATAPVRRFDAAPSGVYDIDGNAREWVGDCAAGCKEHVAMGTAWHSAPGEPNAAQRTTFDADLALNTVGFRVVRELD
jgi:formylglycine-generating enzyme required for sulfatase activity